MKLLDKFENEFKNVNMKSLLPLFKGIEVCDLTVDDHGSFDPKKTIFLGHGTAIEEVIETLSSHHAEHIVQTDREGFVFDLLAASIMLHKPAAFIKNPLPFFINHFKPNQADPNAVRSTTMTLSTSLEKGPILHAIKDFLMDHKKTANFVENVHMIADEMLMNALYNAPTDKNGSPLHMDTDRSEYVDLPDGKKAKIFLTHDDRRLLIGCVDPFGSVNRFKIVQQLNKVFKVGQKSDPNLNAAGAGLGCKMMIESSCGFYMVVKKNLRTIVCCALPLGMSYVKASKLSKNLHMVFF